MITCQARKANYEVCSVPAAYCVRGRYSCTRHTRTDDRTAANRVHPARDCQSCRHNFVPVFCVLERPEYHTGGADCKSWEEA